MVPILPKKIIFAHEAHFPLDGYVNKQNCRVWGLRNQHMVLQKPMCVVACGAEVYIDPSFFENEDKATIKVHWDAYRTMITKKSQEETITVSNCIVFLWIAVKEKCYADKPDTIQHLKANIRDVFGEVPRIRKSILKLVTPTFVTIWMK